MDWFWKTYDLIEKTFWNSLTKKLCAFFFISLFQLILIGYVRSEERRVGKEC